MVFFFQIKIELFAEAAAVAAQLGVHTRCQLQTLRVMEKMSIIITNKSVKNETNTHFWGNFLPCSNVVLEFAQGGKNVEKKKKDFLLFP